MKNGKKMAKVIMAVTGTMARIGYNSASIWHMCQPKEPKMPKDMKKSS